MVYCSNYSLFVLCIIVSIEMRVGGWWSSIDGEPCVGEQDQIFDDQQQSQESFDQGKYNLGLSLLPIHI